jgi:hypothetical protein
MQAGNRVWSLTAKKIFDEGARYEGEELRHFLSGRPVLGHKLKNPEQLLAISATRGKVELDPQRVLSKIRRQDQHKSLRSLSPKNQKKMFRNFIETTRFDLFRSRFYSSANLLIIVLSLAASMIMYQLVNYQFNFDFVKRESQGVYRISESPINDPGTKLSSKRPNYLNSAKATSGRPSYDAVAGSVPYNNKIAVGEELGDENEYNN